MATDAAFARAVLPRAVHVAEAERRVVDARPGQLLGEEPLGGELARAVRVRRRLGSRLGQRQVGGERLTVHSGRGSRDHARRTRLPRRPGNDPRSFGVDRPVALGVAGRRPDTLACAARCTTASGANSATRRGKRRVEDVERPEPRVRMEVLGRACRQVVDDADLVSAGDQRVHEVRADEPGAAGDENRMQASRSNRSAR